MEKVIAIVVTYNRQLQLSQCIDALRNQTRKPDNILVINNGSTDSTGQWLSQQADLNYITQKNVGGSGGFARGIKTAFAQNYDWLWMMDDDGYPKSDSLEKLLEGDDEKMCLRNCAVIDIGDKKTFVWKTGEHPTLSDVTDLRIKDVAHPFNGTLLHRTVIEKVGFPKANLFLWGDETEYLYRIIRKYKIPCYTKTDSIHYHPLCPYSYKNDWEFPTNWKMYYYIRNRFYILKTKFSQSLLLACLMYFVFLISFAGTVIVYQRTNKLKKLVFIFWPMIDAFANDTKATPGLITKRLSLSYSSILQQYIFYPVKLVRSAFNPAATSTL